MIRVLLVDDQELVRSGFRMLINSQPDLCVLAEASSGTEAIAKAEAQEFDVVLMDVRMPGLDGIAATGILTQAHPQVHIIVLTTFDLDEYVLSAIHAGASGFLLKDTTPEELLRAIRTVAAGDAVISPSMTRRLIAHVGPLIGQANSQLTSVEPVSLTARETEVLVLMAQGCSNGEIAAELVVAEATVKTHVAHILAKTCSRDRVQAVIYAYESGLVLP